MPQGSISGPVVFLLHRNDCPVSILGTDTVLIASDTNILIKTANEHDLNKKKTKCKFERVTDLVMYFYCTTTVTN